MKTLSSIIESVQIFEGGAIGHMSHLFEDGDLTFEQIRDIVASVLKGEVRIFEKVDGQALSVTVIDDEVYAARNKTTLKKPMSLEELDKKFSDRSPEVHKAFTNAMKAVRKAILALPKKERDEIFENGKNYMAFEIIDPETRNVIDYGNQLVIRMHGITYYDDNWNVTGEDKKAAAHIEDMLRAQQLDTVDDYRIISSKLLAIRQAADDDDEMRELKSDFENVYRGYSLSTKIGTYVADRFMKQLRNAMPELPKDDELDRLILGKYCPTSGLKATTTQLKKYMKERTDIPDIIPYLDENAQDMNYSAVEPLENVIIKAGVIVMKRAEGFLAADPKTSAQRLKDELRSSIEEFTKNEQDENKLKKLRRNIEKIKAYKDMPMQPSEGILFAVGDKLYKMTGQFGAVNQILGLYRYGR